MNENDGPNEGQRDELQGHFASIRDFYSSSCDFEKVPGHLDEDVPKTDELKNKEVLHEEILTHDEVEETRGKAVVYPLVVVCSADKDVYAG